MGDSPHDPPITPYGRETTVGPQFGAQATCELCGYTKRCFDEYGLVACQHCYQELLPGEGGPPSF